MPKETFNNLPQEKQKRIIEAATSEFATKGYVESSVDSIAKAAGVSKGSIYQYFENKKELYFTVIDEVSQKKIELLENITNESLDKSFFDMIEAAFYQGLDLIRLRPDYIKLYHDIYLSAPEDIKKEAAEKIESLSRKHYEIIISTAVAKGEIRQDISKDIAAFVVYSLLKDMGLFLVERGLLEDKNKMESYIKQFVNILKYGISRGGSL